MPLSEDDQRIFRDIENSFYESDPEFARRVANSPDVVGHVTSTMKLAALGLAVGIVAVVALLPVGPIFSFLGFALMVASALLFVDSARKAGKIGLQSLNDVVKERRETLDEARQRMRNRMKRDED